MSCQTAASVILSSSARAARNANRWPQNNDHPKRVAQSCWCPDCVRDNCRSAVGAPTGTRPRLLRQPPSFEGFMPTWERANGPERSFTQAGNHEPESLTDFRSRVLDMPGHVNKRNNAILRVAEVVDLETEVIEVFGEGRFEPSHAVMSAVGGALQPSISRVPDEVGREVGERSIDSFRAKGLEGVSHDLHVLLRHRPPSIPHAQESAWGGSRRLRDGFWSTRACWSATL